MGQRVAEVGEVHDGLLRGLGRGGLAVAAEVVRLPAGLGLGYGWLRQRVGQGRPRDRVSWPGVAGGARPARRSGRVR